MFGTLNTLWRGMAARSEEALRDRHAVALLDQKIRDSAAHLQAAKLTLAGLIGKERLETRQLSTIRARIDDLTDRAGQALAAGRDDMATVAATAIADLENEAATRQATVASLTERVERLRFSLERASRRMADLRQAAATARAAAAEGRAKRPLGNTVAQQSDMAEAEELVGRIMGAPDPFEEDEILRGIDAAISHTDVHERMAEAGFGAKTRVSAADVLARLKTPR